MTKYVPGIIISSILLMLLLFLDQKIYGGIMPLNLLILLLSLHVIVYAHLMQRQKQRIRYVVFVCLFAVCAMLSLPKVTQQAAEELALANYPLLITAKQSVPMEKSLNPFKPNRAYVFEGIDKEQQSIAVLVNPDTGDVHVLD
ncbi:hypothetical protein [Sporosarcina sp. OR05]|uniref:hypothetical protein n=1 Tax=Sporosarcina sp. OR05 TaxID=2969819 RepID=UPI00352BB9AF